MIAAKSAALEAAVASMRHDGLAAVQATDLWSVPAIAAVTDAGEAFFAQALQSPKRYMLKAKPFLLSSRGTTLTATHPLRSLLPPIQEAMQDIAGVPMRCFSAEFWGVRPVNAEYAYSQQWHRDHEDPMVLKLFLYLRDIAPEHGPLEYVRGSHRSDVEYCARQKYADSHVQMPPDRVASCVGPAGTALFANTGGIHRGGRITQGHRLQAVWAFLPVSSPLWGQPLGGGGR